MSPSRRDMASVQGSVHQHILYNFNSCCLRIHETFQKHREPGECCLMSVREYMWVRPGEIWPVYRDQYINISSITSIVAVSGYMKHSRNTGGIR